MARPSEAFKLHWGVNLVRHGGKSFPLCAQTHKHALEHGLWTVISAAVGKPLRFDPVDVGTQNFQHVGISPLANAS